MSTFVNTRKQLEMEQQFFNFLYGLYLVISSYINKSVFYEYFCKILQIGQLLFFKWVFYEYFC